MRQAPGLKRIAASVGQAVGDSPLNPNTIIDTIGVIGGASAAQELEKRIMFAAGMVSAPRLWFVALSVGASAVTLRL